MFNKTFVFLSFGLISTTNVFAETLLPNNATMAGACNVENIGAYSGTVNMVPHFEPATYACNPGYYLPAGADACAICPINSYCAGGTYTYDTTVTRGIASCPDGLVAPTGMWETAQCGHILHVGNAYVYLRSVKKTNPSLHVKFGDTVFYGNMTTADVPMNINTERKLKLKVGDVVYSVYDDTITPNE